MAGWAARYSLDIEGDLARGFSFMGWELAPSPTEAEARQDLQDLFGYSTDAAEDANVAQLATGEWLPAHDGLCAYWCRTREGAIDLARRHEGDRFVATPLWLFPADYLGRDQTDDADIVRAIGPAELVSD